MSWETLAACRPEFNDGHNVGHLFFADDAVTHESLTGRLVPVAYAQAKAICARCPVHLACLDDALAHEQQGQRYGIRAGMSGRERDMRRRVTDRAVS